MYFVGEEFAPDEGGYKTLPNAIKAAGKRKAKVFDTSGAVVWPAEIQLQPDEEPEPEENEAAAEELEEEKEPDESRPEAAEGEKEKPVEKLVVSASLGKPGVIGTVRVIRAGLLAVRNAPSWEDGHKNGIVKTGYTTEVDESRTVDGEKIYHAVAGFWISGKKEDTIFTAE
nr:MAG TPA: hypothetical protein [Caudoviricetes sp.]